MYLVLRKYHPSRPPFIHQILCKTSWYNHCLSASFWGSKSSVRTQRLDTGSQHSHILFVIVHIAHILRPICFAPFCFNAPANAHSFLIHTLSFSVQCPFAGCTLFRYFLQDNHFLLQLFRERNLGVKQGLGVSKFKWFRLEITQHKQNLLDGILIMAGIY